MKALVWEAPRSMAMRELPVPALQPGEVLIKVAYAGICGSELSGYLGHNALRVPPLVMGHEFSGEIVALDSEAVRNRPDLAEGQRVTVYPFSFCQTCEYCLQGLNQLCVTRRLLGAHRPGAFAQYIAVPAGQVFVLPERMPLRIGALAEPVACGVRIGELAGSVQDQPALVIGAGPMGLLTLQVLRWRGAKQVWVADLDTQRLEMVAELGGTPLDARAVDVVKAVRDATDGRGAWVSIDAVGTAVTRAQCVAAVRTMGTMILSGLHEESSAIPAAEIIRREITVRGSFSYSFANFQKAIDLLALGAIRLDPWVVEAPLADGGLWFERLLGESKDVAKVLLVP
jgi:threonine dehydrogenase-like Zn-dependent dehydrogenase